MPDELLEVSYQRIPNVLRPSRSPLSVYTVDAEPVEPTGVPDADLTGELWLMKATTFTKIGEIYKNDRFKSDGRTIQIIWEWAVKL
jgi:hypothetical protein